MTILSPRHYEWFAYAMVLGMAFGWGARDIYLLSRHVGRRGAERAAVVGAAAVRDQVFGSIIGILICLIGLTGLYLHHRQGA